MTAEYPLDYPQEDSPEFHEYLATIPDDQHDRIAHMRDALRLSGLTYRASELEAEPSLPAPLGVLDARITIGACPTEIAAEASYDDVLGRAQVRLRAAAAAGQAVRTIFVPSMVPDRHDYRRHLSRLAQDINVPIVTKIPEFSGNGTFRTFMPPRATSVEAFWAEQEGSAAAAEYRLGKQQRSPVEEMANVSAEALQALPPDARARQDIREIAYGTDAVYGVEMAAARLVLAKLQDEAGYAELCNIIEARRSIAYNYIDVPLGEYLRQNEVRAAAFLGRARTMLAEAGDDASYESLRYLSPLVFSGRLAVGSFLTDHLVRPRANNSEAVRKSLSTYFRHMEVVEYPDVSEHIEKMNQDLVDFLAAQNQARDSEQVSREMIYDAVMVSNILLEWPYHRNPGVLGEHLLRLYQEAGSVLTCRDGLSLAHKWARQYMQYRRQYGDLAEISQHIRIVGE